MGGFVRCTGLLSFLRWNVLLGSRLVVGGLDVVKKHQVKGIWYKTKLLIFGGRGYVDWGA